MTKDIRHCLVIRASSLVSCSCMGNGALDCHLQTVLLDTTAEPRSRISWPPPTPKPSASAPPGRGLIDLACCLRHAPVMVFGDKATVGVQNSGSSVVPFSKGISRAFFVLFAKEARREDSLLVSPSFASRGRERTALNRQRSIKNSVPPWTRGDFRRFSNAGTAHPGAPRPLSLRATPPREGILKELV